MNLTTKLKNIMPSTQRKVFVSPDTSPEALAVASAAAAEKKDPAAIKDTATPSADAPKKSSAEEIPAPRRRSHKPAHTNNRRKVVGARGRPAASYGTNGRVLNDDEAKMSARNLRRIKRRLFLEAVNADRPASVKPRNSMRHEVSGKKSLRKGKE